MSYRWVAVAPHVQKILQAWNGTNRKALLNMTMDIQMSTLPKKVSGWCQISVFLIQLQAYYLPLPAKQWTRLLDVLPIWAFIDAYGRHTGFNNITGKIDAEIPDALPLSNESIVILDPHRTYILSVVGKADGTFRLQVLWQDTTGAVTNLWDSTETTTAGASVSWILSPTIGGSYIASKSCPTPTAPVGGEWVTINKLQLLASWITLALALAIAASFIGIRRIKKRKL
jgi:hypothetical protein